MDYFYYVRRVVTPDHKWNAKNAIWTLPAEVNQIGHIARVKCSSSLENSAVISF